MDTSFGHRQPPDGHAPACELRREHVIADGAQRRREVICRAGNIQIKIPADAGECGDDICASCPVPDALRSTLACLNLRPVRLVRNGALRTYFSCRWYYSAGLDRQPETIGEACSCCDQWFPRPPFKVLEMFGYWQETEQIRRAIADPSQHPGRWYGSAIQPYRPSSFKGRLLQLLAVAVSNLRMRPL